MTSTAGSNVQATRREDLHRVKRVVVKVGSALIAAEGRLCGAVISDLARDVAELRRRDIEVVLVVSGAVAGGYAALGKARPPKAVVERQAAACIGQPKLIAHFAEAFAAHGIDVAQLLMMEQDIVNRRRFISARHTLNMLLRKGIIPIVNENDPLAEDEDKIGDNDHLAALVTNVASAPWLIILSVVDGVRRDGGHGAIINHVELGSSIDEHVSRAMSASGVGGMRAKVSAARLASHWGVATIIASGKEPGMLLRLFDGEPCGTFFAPRASRLSQRKRWIAFRTKSLGAIQVDDGARDAIVQRRAGLLPSGVREVQGQFAMGSRVDIQDAAGQTFAVGLVSYSAHEVRRMRGRKPTEFQEVLGYEYVPEIVDRDDLVCLIEGNDGGLANGQ